MVALPKVPSYCLATLGRRPAGLDCHNEVHHHSLHFTGLNTFRDKGKRRHRAITILILCLGKEQIDVCILLCRCRVFLTATIYILYTNHQGRSSQNFCRFCKRKTCQVFLLRFAHNVELGNKARSPFINGIVPVHITMCSQLGTSKAHRL